MFHLEFSQLHALILSFAQSISFEIVGERVDDNLISFQKKLPNLDGNSMNFINHWLIIHNLDNIINEYNFDAKLVSCWILKHCIDLHMRYHSAVFWKWSLFYYRANELHMVIRNLVIEIYLVRAYLPRSLSYSPGIRGACKYWIRIFSTNLFHSF